MPTADVWVWILGAMLTANLTVLTVLGKFIKETYDIAGQLDTLMHGRTGDQKGFVQRAEDSHVDLSREQTEIIEQLNAQGRLANEMAYAMRDVAEAVDKLNGHDIDLERLDRLREYQQTDQRETFDPD